MPNSHPIVKIEHMPPRVDVTKTPPERREDRTIPDLDKDGDHDGDKGPMNDKLPDPSLKKPDQNTVASKVIYE